MKKTILTILTIVSVILIAGCTHNNGDIGPWFGQWKVTGIEKNGAIYTEYKGDGIFRFQSEVVAVGKVYPNQGGVSLSTGNWSEVEVSTDANSTKYLSLEFKENGPIGYRNLYLSKNSVLKIVKREGRDKILEYTDDNGDKYTYYLKKW